MKLTPLDIHHKEFHRAMRGYSEAEVDVFLDQVADEFERLFKDNLDHKEQIEKMQEKVKQYEGLEQTLQKALFTAQQAADEVQEKARKESDLIIQDSEARAKEVIQDAITQKEGLQKDLENLRKAEKEFRGKFRELLKSYLGVIDSIEKGEVVAGEEPAAPSEEPKAEAPKTEAPKAEAPSKPAAEEASSAPVAEEVQGGAEPSPVATETPAATSPKVTIGEPKIEERARDRDEGAVTEGKTDEFDFFGDTSFLDKGPRDFGVPGARQRQSSPGWQANPAPATDFQPPSVPEPQTAVQETPGEDKVDAARKVSNFFDEDLGADDEDKEEKSDLDSGELS